MSSTPPSRKNPRSPPKAPIKPPRPYKKAKDPLFKHLDDDLVCDEDIPSDDPLSPEVVAPDDARIIPLSLYPESGDDSPPTVKAIKSNSKTARRFCMTGNNQDKDACCSTIRDLVVALKVSFACVGQEGLADGKTPHLQCYIAYAMPVRFACVRKSFPGFHIEQARGSFQQNVDYCSKEDPNVATLGMLMTRGFDVFPAWAMQRQAMCLVCNTAFVDTRTQSPPFACICYMCSAFTDSFN